MADLVDVAVEDRHERAGDGYEPLLGALADQLEPSGLEVVGGHAAISQDAELTLVDVGLAVERLAGNSRYGTSAAIADRAVERGAPTRRVWLATGLVCPDALAAGPLLGRFDGVLILIDGCDRGDSSLHPDTTDWFERNAADVDGILILGGDNAVTVKAAQKIVDVTNEAWCLLPVNGC